MDDTSMYVGFKLNEEQRIELIKLLTPKPETKFRRFLKRLGFYKPVQVPIEYAPDLNEVMRKMALDKLNNPIED